MFSMQSKIFKRKKIVDRNENRLAAWKNGFQRSAVGMIEFTDIIVLLMKLKASLFVDRRQ